MKKIPFNEFVRRTEEISKARKIFMPNITNNITEAFALYQEILADDDSKMPVTVSRSDGYIQKPTLAQLSEKLGMACSECNSQMVLKEKVSDMDGVIWSSAWFCNQCFAMYYSEKTVQEWLDTIPKNVMRKGGVNGSANGNTK